MKLRVRSLVPRRFYPSQPPCLQKLLGMPFLLIIPRLSVYVAMLVWLITFGAMIVKIGHFCFVFGRQKLRAQREHIGQASVSADLRYLLSGARIAWKSSQREQTLRRNIRRR